ncbi:hypothetical protein Tco_0682954 [Tanacetum coccineum]|uniref:Reverse transcriptase n=1 Tax=Tanacetum coccineum TaxID=301880 RepID=A0ABQ4XSM0_9ASTR
MIEKKCPLTQEMLSKMLSRKLEVDHENEMIEEYRLTNLDRMLARCEETNLVLNWEKCHFMVKEGIVLGHKISGAGIEVDRAKIDVISKLPYPTNIKGVRRAENLAADHLSRLENLDLGTFTEEEITDEFPDEHLMILKAELNSDEPWYADYANYIVGKFVPPNWTPKKRRRFFSQVKNYFWDEPCAFKLYSDNVMRRCVTGNEILEILAHCYSGPTGDIIVRQLLEGKSMNLDSIGRASLKMLMIM